MQETRRKRLCDELRALIGPAPGVAPIGLARVREIVGDVEWDADGYTRGKLSVVLQDFELWLSERGWQSQCGGVPDRFRVRLLLAIEKLEGAATPK
jgi:hypothetical protein